jgi:hypothetical protein
MPSTPATVDSDFFRTPPSGAGRTERDDRAARGSMPGLRLISASTGRPRDRQEVTAIDSRKTPRSHAAFFSTCRLRDGRCRTIRVCSVMGKTKESRSGEDRPAERQVCRATGAKTRQRIPGCRGFASAESNSIRGRSDVSTASAALMEMTLNSTEARERCLARNFLSLTHIFLVGCIRAIDDRWPPSLMSVRVESD